MHVLGRYQVLQLQYRHASMQQLKAIGEFVVFHAKVLSLKFLPILLNAKQN
jgi:hypothetical protein